MEVHRNYCNLASLIVLVILIIFPAKSSSTEDADKPLRKRSENKQLKRFYTADYDSFVGLMGKRHAASALNYANHILADLVQQKRRVACRSVQTFLQKTGCKFTHCGRQRSQPSL